MNFWIHFKRSLSDPRFYKEIAAGQHPLRIWYAVILSFITSLVIAIILTVSLYTVFLPSAKSFIEAHFPADLVITLKSGELSINQPVPYAFPLPQNEMKHGKENMVVIDTNAEATLDGPEHAKTYTLITKNTAIIEKESGEVRAYPLKDMPDFTATRAEAERILSEVYPYAWILSLTALVFFMIASFIGFVMVYLASGFLLWLAMKCFSRGMRYKDAFQASMYAYTFIFLLNILFALGRFGSFGFFSSALLTFLIAFLFMLIPEKVHTS